MTTTPQMLTLAFDNGLHVPDYVDAMTTLKRQMQKQFDQTTLNAEAIETFKQALALYPAVNVLVLTEDYCPDSVMNLPIITKLVESTPNARLKVVYREDAWPLANTFPAADGHSHIPTILIYTPDDGHILAAWHERPAAAQPKMAAYLAENPAPEKEVDGEVTMAFRRWAKKRLTFMTDMYNGGVWRDTVAELTTQINAKD